MFVSYLVIVGYLTLRPSGLSADFSRPYNLVPLRSIIGQMRGEAPLAHRLFELVGNGLILTPLAVLLALCWSRVSGTMVVLLCGSVSAIVEVLQYVTWSRRSADVDDVLLNTAGAVIGFLAARRYQRWSENRVTDCEEVAARPSRRGASA
jgi:glycopeptide antibiotics resistance protein